MGMWMGTFSHTSEGSAGIVAMGLQEQHTLLYRLLAVGTRCPTSRRHLALLTTSKPYHRPTPRRRRITRGAHNPPPARTKFIVVLYIRSPRIPPVLESTVHVAALCGPTDCVCGIELCGRAGGARVK